MAIAVLPRPSLLTTAVVAASVSTGLATGMLAASAALLAYRLTHR